MEDLQLGVDKAIATLTLNRPKTKNAITSEMWVGLREAFAAVEANPQVRVLIVTGANGDFCSGADVGHTGGGEQVSGMARMVPVNDAALALHNLSKPTIAKVDGIAAGAGLNLALGCDLVVASDRSRFSEIFARRALSVDFGGTWLLPRLIGLHKAKELALFADVLSAAEVAELGLVNRIVPAAELDSFVDQWATRLASGPPIALASTKRMLNDGLDASFAEALTAEARSQALNFTTDDVREAGLAWFEKRDTNFSGS